MKTVYVFVIKSTVCRNVFCHRRERCYFGLELKSQSIHFTTETMKYSFVFLAFDHLPKQKETTASFLCRYHVTCTEPDSYMSLSVSGLDLEPAARLCRDDSICRDSLHLTYPTGGCGSSSQFSQQCQLSLYRQ